MLQNKSVEIRKGGAKSCIFFVKLAFPATLKPSCYQLYLLEFSDRVSYGKDGVGVLARCQGCFNLSAKVLSSNSFSSQARLNA